MPETKYHRERRRARQRTLHYVRFQELLKVENYGAAAARLFNDKNGLQKRVTKQELLKLSLGLLEERVDYS